ncbi:hypothetical protein BDV98DRAFT_589213 [Pterulicium gracile]|uniref:Uncharacterized protein n=1 Tax=Pterulicium gracile TaxID=1884261 RepID=A0A5C3QYL8_9AGAR|nr:hypothetical protein BDV98DRAFT_589213 [Pterula gracilis]
MSLADGNDCLAQFQFYVGNKGGFLKRKMVEFGPNAIGSASQGMCLDSIGLAAILRDLMRKLSELASNQAADTTAVTFNYDWILTLIRGRLAFEEHNYWGHKDDKALEINRKVLPSRVTRLSGVKRGSENRHGGSRDALAANRIREGIDGESSSGLDSPANDIKRRVLRSAALDDDGQL